MSALDLVGVTAGGGDSPRVREVTLHAGAGEVVAVLGANGAGKSTLLRVVSGLISPDAGSIALDGVDVSALSAHARARLGFATVIEDRPVFEALTVGENLRVAGARRRDLKSWIASWFPDLAPMTDRRAGLLSGGEQALVALARAAVTAPRVLLVDEISAGLAPSYVAAAAAVLRRTASELGAAVLLAEQRNSAIAGADRIVVLRRGRVAFDGTPMALAERPDLLEVTYLGELG